MKELTGSCDKELTITQNKMEATETNYTINPPKASDSVPYILKIKNLGSEKAVIPINQVAPADATYSIENAIQCCTHAEFVQYFAKCSEKIERIKIEGIDIDFATESAIIAGGYTQKSPNGRIWGFAFIPVDSIYTYNRWKKTATIFFEKQQQPDLSGLWEITFNLDAGQEFIISLYPAPMVVAANNQTPEGTTTATTTTADQTVLITKEPTPIK